MNAWYSLLSWITGIIERTVIILRNINGFLELQNNICHNILLQQEIVSCYPIHHFNFPVKFVFLAGFIWTTNHYENIPPLTIHSWAIRYGPWVINFKMVLYNRILYSETNLILQEMKIYKNCQTPTPFLCYENKVRTLIIQVWIPEKREGNSVGCISYCNILPCWVIQWPKAHAESLYKEDCDSKTEIDWVIGCCIYVASTTTGKNGIILWRWPSWKYRC